jgi:hypothetical protein
MFAIGMPSLPVLLVRTVFNGIIMRILTGGSQPEVPDDVRDLHAQLERGSGGDEAYEWIRTSCDWVDMSDCGLTGLHPEVDAGRGSEQVRHACGSGGGGSVVCVFGLNMGAWLCGCVVSWYAWCLSE